MSKRISFKVDGEVQGVNFRFVPFIHLNSHGNKQQDPGETCSDSTLPFRNFTVKQAKSIGVTGYVQNASDGTVKGEAQGSEDALKEFVSHLNKGPPAASVTGVEHGNVESKDGETGFVVR
ncbi:hypothetical protein E6O75_ATG10855 [Venturia nashicola]|uniref:Acylphosphatase n=1 Tax=Venturia nashicola TaxID=86259 RepID=A0A4Z1PB70_9PEZI|nr:hypothetical protein E6O75_ATG10855 [Venturia nashicola]